MKSDDRRQPRRTRQQTARQGRGRQRAGSSPTELKAKDLRWSCPPIKPSKKRPRLADLLGQERPLAALATGIHLHAPGYNVFLSGVIGSGRTRLVTDFIQREQPAGRPARDRVFVSNFREPNRPRLITLPGGEGPRFREEMRELVQTLHESLQSALRSRTHRVSRDLLLRSADEREQRLMAALDRQAQRDGCAVVQFPAPSGGIMADIYPIYDGEPVNPEVFADLVHQGAIARDDWLRIRTRREVLVERLEQVTDRLLRIGRDTELELRRMDRQVADHVLKARLREFRRRWQQEQVASFLEQMRSHILEDLERWVSPTEPPGDRPEDGTALPADAPSPAPAPALEPQPDGQPAPPRPDPVRYLGVEVHLVNSSTGEDCPVVLEIHPTYQNLFGSAEASRDPHLPGLASVQPGALIRADGGFLILRVSELMAEPGVWAQFKRALKVGQVEIRDFDPHSGVGGGVLQPEAVPIDVTVILIGDIGAYETFAHEDPQFLNTFKVHAEFDSAVPATRSNLQRYANLLAFLSDSEGLLPFHPDAAAAVAEYGARCAGQRSRLTTRYGLLADLAREASFLCRQGDADTVSREHVREALAQRRYRGELFQEHTERDFEEGYLLLQTSGSEVGQINALTVLESGTVTFGKPSRITAATGAGSKDRTRLLNIEREAQLSGPIYDKGVMILEGYLLEKLGRQRPLALQATLCFEQTYSGIDGDSAAAAELICVLSSLSQVPILQGLGITGAINQKGVIGAVSGLNDKIEGFFRLCESRGLTGDQGVVLPRANVSDLMLDPDVVAAVDQGRFHVHAVDNVEQALALMTGRPAAEVMRLAEEELSKYRSTVPGTDG
ncbi:MAG: AAA family ATPase [Planctomycetota bacterium]